VNTGDDWQKSQWLPPRLAQGTRVIRQASCGRRRVGEVGEDRSSSYRGAERLFSRTRGNAIQREFRISGREASVLLFSCEFDLTIVVAAAHRAEMLHTFPSMKNSGGRRPCSAQPDRTGCLHPPHKHGLKLGTTSCSIEQYAEQLTCKSSPHGKRKIWESGKCTIREETRGFT
jgi:hypothetical protein